MKTITAFLAVATIGLIPASAIATTAPEKLTFEHEGSRYTYTVTHRHKTKIIRGVEEKSGKRFDLRVYGRRVTGTVDFRPVAFQVSEARNITPPVIATRD